MPRFMVAATPYYFAVFITMFAFYVFVITLMFSRDKKSKDIKKGEEVKPEKQKKE